MLILMFVPMFSLQSALTIPQYHSIRLEIFTEIKSDKMRKSLKCSQIDSAVRSKIFLSVTLNLHVCPQIRFYEMFQRFDV
jgi:hypothetical protein